ncbi:rhomboid family intramembrane serine protease [Jhaorihella thermophila]|uniref:Membrane associated serine protease, rhomboid family n=1 Tax=Jhaorihella thermophila TaxID=488547 RepID=A0A1H5WL52_9RHOB|nr:rhomboid family intramembrane serine protease [Jhaorihella thermophila]SEG00212.1 Membrane associated serine protease, rhomboid family [Jhaorihella thermophila]
MSSHQPPHPPVNPLPPVVAALFLVILGIEVAFSLGARGIVGGPAAVGWRLGAIQDYAFSGEILDWMWENGRWPLRHVIRFVTYPFVHTSFTHALFVGVFLLAMGKMVGEVFGNVATLAVFVLSGIGGALAYGVLLDDPMPLIGGFPAVYGLIGAFTWLLQFSLARIGANQVRAFYLIAFLMGFQLLFGLLFGGSRDWVADLAGFATGYGLSFVVSPGGWARIRSRIRHD